MKQVSLKNLFWCKKIWAKEYHIPTNDRFPFHYALTSTGLTLQTKKKQQQDLELLFKVFLSLSLIFSLTKQKIINTKKREGKKKKKKATGLDVKFGSPNLSVKNGEFNLTLPLYVRHKLQGRQELLLS